MHVPLVGDARRVEMYRTSTTLLPDAHIRRAAIRPDSVSVSRRGSVLHPFATFLHRSTAHSDRRRPRLVDRTSTRISRVSLRQLGEWWPSILRASAAG